MALDAISIDVKIIIDNILIKSFPDHSLSIISKAKQTSNHETESSKTKYNEMAKLFSLMYLKLGMSPFLNPHSYELKIESSFCLPRMSKEILETSKAKTEIPPATITIIPIRGTSDTNILNAFF